MAFRIAEPFVESYSMPTAPSSSVKAAASGDLPPRTHRRYAAAYFMVVAAFCLVTEGNLSDLLEVLQLH
jgi:hypothetical protein